MNDGAEFSAEEVGRAIRAIIGSLSTPRSDPLATRRKVIQILLRNDALVALCDDGTIHVEHYDRDGKPAGWRQIKHMPDGCAP